MDTQAYVNFNLAWNLAKLRLWQYTVNIPNLGIELKNGVS